MHDDVLAPLHAGDADDAMKMIRCHDLNGVQVFFFFQQLAEIGKGRAALECVTRTLSGIVSLNKAFGHVAASRNGSFRSRLPFRLTECLPQVIEKVFPSPIALSDRMLRGGT